MRVALAGKGGVGKTTIAATLARLAARGGAAVVAVDADSNPNLGAALGAASLPAPLPTELVSRRLGGPGLSASVADVLDRHAVVAPDGVRLVTMGMPAHADEGCLCAQHAVVSALLEDLDAHVVVLDLEASPEHLARGTARHVDLLLLVVEPYYRSLEAARRMAALAADLPIPRLGVVANKVRDEEDADAISAFCERSRLALVGLVPRDEAVVDADVAATPLLDAAPASAAAAAVAGLLPLLDGTATPAGTSPALP